MPKRYANRTNRSSQGSKGELVSEVALKFSRPGNRPPGREQEMMTVAEGPKIERGVGFLADFHGRPMINFRSQQNAHANLALRHQAAIAQF